MDENKIWAKIGNDVAVVKYSDELDDDSCVCGQSRYECTCTGKLVGLLMIFISLRIVGIVQHEVLYNSYCRYTASMMLRITLLVALTMMIVVNFSGGLLGSASN